VDTPISVTGGTVTLLSDGTLDIQPDGTGTAITFPYTISDGNGGTDTANVDVTIGNTPPVAEDDSASTTVDALVNVDVLANNGNGLDSDVDGDTLTITDINGTTPVVDTPISVTGGTVTLLSDGTLDIQPDGTGTAITFPYTISDGNGGTDTANVDVTIVPKDENPTAEPDTASTLKDTPVTTGNVLENDSVLDNATITSFDAISTKGGTVVNNSDGTFDYTPATGFVGKDTFTYTLCDDDTPKASCSIATVTVTVGTSIDTDGDGISDSQEVIDGTNPENACDHKGGTTPGTADCDTDGLTNDEETTGIDDPSTPANPDGTITDPTKPDTDGDGVLDGIEILGGTDPNDPCSLDAVYITEDKTTTVDCIGNPTAENDSVSTFKNTPVTTGNVLENDTVLDGATITKLDTTTTNGGTVVNNQDGTFTYTPASDFVGEDTFTYTLCDDDKPIPSCSTATVTVNVASVIEPIVDDYTATPVLVGESTPSIIDNDTFNGNPIVVGTGKDEVTLTPNPNQTNEPGFTFNADGTITISEDVTEGTYELEYQICENEVITPNCAIAKVKILVKKKSLPCGTPYNIMTPDNDGDNDVFFISCIDKPEYANNRVEIFNRWGNTVYKASGYNNSDVSFKGISNGRATITVDEKLPP
ncbi:tandem-95 repeat protein, partial [Tenacibaculum piscium]|uniref:Ig-like domain-containing protein n=1 Tax=Tenacibaculum piscium TaxID=1458515 RepID=UPI00187B8D1E